MRMGGENSDLIQSLSMMCWATASFADAGDLQIPCRSRLIWMPPCLCFPSNAFGDESHTLQRLEEK